MINKVKNSWNDITLRRKFLLIILITCILIGVGNLYAFRNMERAYNQELYAKSVQLMTLLAESIQNELDRVIYDSENMISDKSLQKKLSDISRSDDREKIFYASRSLEDRILELRFYSTDIESLCLIDSTGKQYGRYEFMNTIEERDLETMASVGREAKGREVWIYNPEFTEELVMVRDIREAQDFTLNSIGTLIMKVKLDNIVTRVCKPLKDADMEPLIAIYYNGDGMYENEVLKELSMPQKYAVYESEWGKLLCSRYSFLKSGWDYVMALPYDSIFQTVNHALMVSLWILAGTFIFVILSGCHMTASIVKHLEKLILQCDAFGRGEYVAVRDSSNPHQKRKDEIGKLYRHFDYMAAENKKMIQEIYVKQQLLLETQVSNLRAQIRSHFIYNTLEAIYCLAVGCEDKRIGEMSSLLGKFLHMTLKEQRSLITIREDMEIAAAYLKIQSIRLEERLAIDIHIEKRYEDISIPSMTIQPVVENAVLYGIENMLEGGKIWVYCREKGGFAELIVEDNGEEIDPDVIQKLERKEIAPKGLGIGLVNIQKRLKLLLSEQCGIFITREEDRNQVIIRLLAEKVSEE